MADWTALVAEAEDLLAAGKCLDGVHKINACMELGGAGAQILREPAEVLGGVLPKLTPEQGVSLRRMYKVQGDLLAGLWAQKRAAVEHGCAGHLAHSEEGVKAKKAKSEAAAGQGSLEKGADGKVPATILTGFLGIGKKTLLNHILQASHGMLVAVVANEFGELGIDGMLMKGGSLSEEENITQMNNGCICWTVRGDLISGLKMLVKNSKKSGKHLHGLLIDSTGLENPASVAQTLFADDFVQRNLRLEGILTIVDAEHVIQHLDEKPEGGANKAVEQIALADRLLLDTCDLADPEGLDHLEQRIRAINKTVPIKRTANSDVDMEFILGIRRFSLDKIMEMDDAFPDDWTDHQHGERVSSVGIDVVGEVEQWKLDAWVGRLVTEKGVDLSRSKGVLAVKGMKDKYVFQAIHMHFAWWPQAPWAEGEVRRCKMVFIGKQLNREELTRGLLACMAK